MLQSFMAERPLVAGLLWAAIAFSLSLVLGAWDGETFTIRDLIADAGAWAAGGFGFGAAMRLISRWNARHAR